MVIKHLPNYFPNGNFVALYKNPLKNTGFSWEYGGGHQSLRAEAAKGSTEALLSHSPKENEKQLPQLSSILAARYSAHWDSRSPRENPKPHCRAGWEPASPLLGLGSQTEPGLCQEQRSEAWGERAAVRVVYIQTTS